MKTIRISDITLSQKVSETLTFREKIELAKLLDRLQADVIELSPVKNPKADSLYIKTVANTVSESTVCVQVSPDKEEIDMVWDALKNAKKARIQIAAPVSLVQMEYIKHSSQDKLKAVVSEAAAYAKTLTCDVEFLAEDATRAEKAFLCDLFSAAAAAGAGTVTVKDSAGTMLPEEFAAFVKEISEKAELNGAVLGISASNALSMADACSVAAVCAGAGEIKAAIYPKEGAGIENLVNIIKLRGSDIEIATDVRTVEISRLADQAENLFTQIRSKTSPFENGVQSIDPNRYFTVNDDIAAIVKETEALGYDLSEEDKVKVYESFKKAASRKERVYAREIDAIVASSAMQVPPTYKLDDFIINAGTVFSATAHLRVTKNGEIKESVAIGDGPIDAAFLAIEQITGKHYELDDFQIQSVTEGREAMGEAVVKLRSEGKLYSGRGLSTDIIGSSILAYVNALNKIAYEEANV